AIDAASLDLVNRQIGLAGTLLQAHHQPGEDKFRGTWEHTRGDLQLSYAEECGLGTRDYRIREI
ncbi:MAG TPA: 4Fe-4S ferredoxin, partial [Methanomicrobiales archaeon]|nr:4Fe-4S ferredoxin [Methanomicrobiales archaeon]